MKKKYEHKMNMKHILRVMFVCLITLAMVSSLLTVPVKAATVADADTADTKVTPSGWWTDNGNYNTSWYNSSQQNFTITTAQQLAGLAYLVNAGTDFSGKTITLGADIDLGAHYWKPIGGDGTYSGSVPNGNAFAGDFDGGYTNSDGTLNTRVISNMMIQWNVGDTTPAGVVSSTTDYGGFGLFGYVTNGTIENLTVKGSIASNAIAYCVGGIVGYTSGSIYHCQNEVEIAIDNTSPSQCGGIAGTVENITTNGVRYVQFCSNTANVQGRGRIGGIIGAVYCVSAGGVVVDDCYNTGNLATVSESRRAYAGGIVGYCRGYIQNCYSVGTLSTTSTTTGGHYLAGLVGLLQGANPEARLTNSYTVPTFVNADGNYDRMAYASADKSDTLQINNVLWAPESIILSDDNTDDNEDVNIIAQEVATGSNQWGFWSDTGYTTVVGMQSAEGVATVYTTSEGGGSTSTTKNVLTVLGGKFTTDSANQNDGYPILTWQKDGIKRDDFSGSHGGTEVTADTFYLSRTGSDSNSGEDVAHPVQTLGRAVGLGNASTASAVTIYVMNTITIEDESVFGSYSGSDSKITLKMNSSYPARETDQMFIVEGNAYVGSINVDSTAFAKAFKVNGNLYLRNNAKIYGSATGLNVSAGANVTLNRASIDATTVSVYLVNSTSAGVATCTIASSELNVNGYIHIGNGAYMIVKSAIPTNLSVLCQPSSLGLKVAEGDGYTLTSSDAAKVSYAGGAYRIALNGNNLVLSN